jgi:lipoprotein-anchoring transpeptidase ErfK/SrfK
VTRPAAAPVATSPPSAVVQARVVSSSSPSPSLTLAKALKVTKLPTMLSRGATGVMVSAVQQRLVWTGLVLHVNGIFDLATYKAVRKFQGKQGLHVSGTVDSRTYKRLVLVTRRGAGLDPRCASSGQVLCIDKSQKVLRYLVGGRVVLTVDVRFGSANLPTREGVFQVYEKDRYHVSTLYHTPMPFAMFFSGGQAVHYSKFFAAVGYAGHSHGCVNVRDMHAILTLFSDVQIGTKVVIYRTAASVG